MIGSRFSLIVVSCWLAIWELKDVCRQYHQIFSISLSAASLATTSVHFTIPASLDSWIFISEEKCNASSGSPSGECFSPPNDINRAGHHRRWCGTHRRWLRWVPHHLRWWPARLELIHSRLMYPVIVPHTRQRSAGVGHD